MPNSAGQRADHVDRLRALLDQQIARPVYRQRRLLLGRLHWHEPHCRPRHRLANRFRIGSVCLPSLHIWLIAMTALGRVLIEIGGAEHKTGKGIPIVAGAILVL